MATTPAEISHYVDENWSAIVADISRLVSIESVEDQTSANSDAPWGEGPRRALSCALSMADRLGLQTHDCDGIIGFADVPGEVEGQVATIAHLDVVPAGPGWDSNPFSLQKRENYLVGRGVLDDKGPAVLTLWAAHYLAAEGRAAGRKTVRILLGVNEETGMGDARWYVRNYSAPDFLFTPDSAWPVVCGEKGSHNAELAWECDPQGRIVEIDGGTVRNAVAASAKAVVRIDTEDLPAAMGITVSPVGLGLSEVSARGTGGHAADPEGTVSAIGVLVGYLLQNGVCSALERRWLEFENRVFSSTDGSAFGIEATDDLFTPLTIISGTIETKGRQFVQTTDCRYPKSTNAEAISAGIKKTCARYGVEYSEIHRGMPLYVNPESPEVKILLECYSKWFGKPGKPVTLGGGTYAKRFPYAVGFGPIGACDEDAPSWVGGIHGPNEAVPEESLKRALCTYISALEWLSQVGTREGANRVW